MKSILKRLLVLLLVVGSVYGVSRSGAWFTDEEVLGDNTFSTGIIDITVDNISESETNLRDMKPSQVDYLDYLVHNTEESNPVNLFKTLYNPRNEELGTSEPECLAEGGQWLDGKCSGNTPTANLGTKIRYDMRVELYDKNPMDQKIDPVWWETIYLDSDDVTLSELWNKEMYLGMIPAGWYMKVMQSYHMPGDVGNAYQSDALTFNTKFVGRQLGADLLVLENKYEANGDVSHHVWDGISATLGYTVRDRTFNYTLNTQGITGPYTLIAWSDPDNLWTWADRATEAVVLAQVTGPVTNLSDSVELGKDLINAKVWLVPGTFGTVGGLATGFPNWTGSMPTGTLFETGLMDYYDSDL